ncbi:sodium/phosphate symporter [Natronococcus pandeyae]|uniref:Sodium/phosphate symporter n=1 Tax=Natronococcus pandeyae TaxID=2055836 RepID=A0A8J8TRT0_9EURY|nr:sodium/phosphate symporter [Natronococcus pandeyae]TYL37852.1 sodium/phosphate symporter [Natronococcus pandeyae]
MGSRLGKVAVIVVTVAITARLLPLLWTPHPFNPDGFVFASQARDAIAAGTLPLESINPQGYIYPTLLALTGVITDVAPLALAQPTIAVVGAIPPVLAVLLVWRLASHHSRESAITLAALAAGLTLALEGLYLRRTVTVSYEVLGLLFVALVAIGAYRFCRTRRPAWGVATGMLLVALPITHHLSTFMAALTLTGVVVLAVARDWQRALAPGLVVLALPFWGYVLGYYALTRPPFSDDLASKPGLFAAWVIVMAIGALWLARARARPLRLAIAGVAVGGFGILGANALWELFPATAATPPRLLVYVAPLTVLAALAIWGLPLGTGPEGDRAIVLALLVAPLAWVGFAVTAGVDPVYALFARRGQTFVHLATVVCAGLAIVALARRVDPSHRRVVTVGLPILLCVCALASLPLAFAGLEALAYQGTTTSEEFETAGFATATLGDDWTSDDHITRVASNYHGTSASPQPAYGWLHGGGGDLQCPTVMQASWQTVGAQQYPADPLSIDQLAYSGTVTTEHAVYATTGADPVTIVVPTGERAC